MHGEGVLRARACRHPVLALRARRAAERGGAGGVVANDLALGERAAPTPMSRRTTRTTPRTPPPPPPPSTRPTRPTARRPPRSCSGPNAGGKTVALKSFGLVALLARAGVPVPAAAGARVDFFDPILADIGDMQSVANDLSTFGHLLVCNAVLRRVRADAAASASAADDGDGEGRADEARPLVLLDEIGTGTDPAQGVALAQSVLEALVAARSRVVVTTNFQNPKQLGAKAP